VDTKRIQFPLLDINQEDTPLSRLEWSEKKQTHVDIGQKDLVS